MVWRHTESRGTAQHTLMLVLCIFILFLLRSTNAHIYHNIFSLYIVHSYMIWHFCVNLREFRNLYCAQLRKFLELKLLILQFHNIIGLKYYLAIAEWYNIVCAMLQYLVQAVRLCGCPLYSLASVTRQYITWPPWLSTCQTSTQATATSGRSIIM